MQAPPQKRVPNHFHGNYKDDKLPYEGGPKSLKLLGVLLRIGLVLFVPLATMIAGLTLYFLVDSPNYYQFLARRMEAQSWMIYSISAIELAYRLTYIYCIILSSWVLFRAARNLHTVAPGQIETKPHMAWLWFFIPFANFYKPYKAVAEIDRVTRTTIGVGRSTSPLIMTWWVLFILSILVGATNFSIPVANMFLFGLVLDLLSGVFAIIAAILFARIVGTLAEFQSHLSAAGVAQTFE